MNVLERIPASPPLSGTLWTIVIPAALFLVTLWGTVALYRRFSRTEY